LTYRILFICCFFLSSIVSCAPQRNLFVLLPDPDGKVGRIEVSNKGGSQLLTEPRQMTEVKDAMTAPSPPVPMKEEEILKLFFEALSAQPEPPLTFLLYFATGTTRLSEESQRQIQDFLKAIATRQPADISIVGHTDRVGSRESNYRLGLERAAAIKALLVSEGAAPDSIEIASHGEDNPLIRTEDGVAEPRNRRVEVTVR
jgi:outer membrane protein OmpA-like peptidoglycan-associated protein